MSVCMYYMQTCIEVLHEIVYLNKYMNVYNTYTNTQQRMHPCLSTTMNADDTYRYVYMSSFYKYIFTIRMIFECTYQ